MEEAPGASAALRQTGLRVRPVQGGEQPEAEPARPAPCGGIDFLSVLSAPIA